MTYYVYELVDPRNGEVFYVGKGCRGRIDAHEVEARAGRLSRKCDRIREIETAGQVVGKRKVRTFVDEGATYDFEVELIEAHGLARLTNVSSGGFGGRMGLNLSKDREDAEGIALFFNLTKGGTVATVYVNGDPLDLLEIANRYRKDIGSIIARRGRSWVNRIAAEHGVEFSHA
jgi:LEM3-like protein